MASPPFSKALFVAVIIFFSGCTSAPSDKDPLPEGTVDPDMIRLDSSGVGAQVYALLALEDTNITIALSNNRTPAADVGRSNSCGGMAMAAQPYGPGFVSTAFSHVWSEGPGYQAHVGGQGQSLSVPGGGGLELAINATYDWDIAMKAGAALTVRLSALTMDGPPVYDPFAAVSAPPGALDVRDLGDVAFVCGSSLESAEGTRVGAVAGPQFVVSPEATMDWPTQGYVEVMGAVNQDPRFAGTCGLSIIIDGQVVESDEQTNSRCSARVEDMAEEAVSLKFGPVIGAGTSVDYWLWCGTPDLGCPGLD